MPRNLNEIEAAKAAAKEKAHKILADLKVIKDQIGDNPTAGQLERVKNLTTAAKRVTDDVEALEAEWQGAANTDIASGRLTVVTPEGFAGGGAGNGTLAKRERLGREDSVAAWAKARGLEEDGQLVAGINPEEAWSAWFRGYAGGEWNDFRSMFRNQMGTSPDADGGFLVPTPLSTFVIDKLRSATPIFEAGAQTVPMTSKTLDIARVSADADATVWHAENAAITASKPTLERVRFTAKTLPVLTKASRELVEDAPNTGAVVAQSIAGATAVELTRAALRGDGTSNSPTGIANQTGIGTTAVGGDVSWITMANAVRDRRIDNSGPNAYITSPRTATALELTQTADGMFVPPPPSVAALGAFSTTVIPTNLGAGTNETEIYVGDFTKLLIGLRVQLRIEPLRERFADNGQVAWLSWLRADVQLEQPKAFGLLSGVTN